MSTIRKGNRQIWAKGPGSRLAFAMMLGVVLLAFTLRIWRLGYQELTFDEVASFSIAVRGPIGLLQYIRSAVREHPPGYYLLLSAWISLAGTSEFTLRFLSVVIGVISVAALYRVVRGIGGRSFALLATCLLALSPLHIRISRDARMYGLLALWSLLSTFAFAALIDEEGIGWPSSLTERLDRVLGATTRTSSIDGRAFVKWGLFWLVTGVGMFTHYFMVFVLLAENLFLLLTWRRHRHVLLGWVVVHVTLAGVVVIWAISSPGLWATVLSLWRRGPTETVRWGAFASGLNGLYLGTTVRPNWRHLGWPLIITVLGVVPLGGQGPWPSHGRRRWRLLLGLLLGVPTLAVFALPERFTGRYLTVALPGAVLVMATGLASTYCFSRELLRRRYPGRLCSLASGFAALGLLSCLLLVSARAYPAIYFRTGTSFTAKMEHLRAHAQPDDGLLLHGPWQQLLLSYYDAGSLATYTVPLRDLRVDRDLMEEVLEEILREHDRLWVSYDSVSPVDPDWVVARWLHEHSHQVLSQKGLTLYVQPPADRPPLPPAAAPPDRGVAGTGDPSFQVLLPLTTKGRSTQYDRVEHVGVTFEDQLHLEDIALFNLELSSGEAILFLSRWRALHSIPAGLGMRIELVSPDEQVWQKYEFETGPAHIGSQARAAGDTFVERRGLVIPIGTPPGNYKLRLRVFSSGEEWLPEDGRAFEASWLQVRHSSPNPRAIQALPGRELSADFGGTLELIGYAPWGRDFTLGNPLLFDIYWKALDVPEDNYEVKLEVVNGGGAVLTEKRVQPVADWHPTSSWKPGGILKGHYAIPTPVDAAPGRYRVRLSVIASDGSALPLRGVRSQKVLDWWEREKELSGTSLVLFEGKLESRPRRYRAPAMDHRTGAVFGTGPDQRTVELLGYDLIGAPIAPGDSVEVTLYWKTLQRMDRVYAVFNHLVAADGEMLAQQDGWPRQGTYHTTHWLPGEVVEDHYTIEVPPDTPPGEYTLRIGMYDAVTTERLLCWVEGAPVPERYIELASMTIGK